MHLPYFQVDSIANTRTAYIWTVLIFLEPFDDMVNMATVTTFLALYIRFCLEHLFTTYFTSHI